MTEDSVFATNDERNTLQRSRPAPSRRPRIALRHVGVLAALLAAAALAVALWPDAGLAARIAGSGDARSAARELASAALTRAWMAGTLLLLAAVLVGWQFRAWRVLSEGLRRSRDFQDFPALVGGSGACREVVGVADALSAARNSAAEALGHANEVLSLTRATWQQCSDGVLLVDPTGAIVYANPAAQALLRDPESSLMGAAVHTLLPGVTVDALEDLVRERSAAGGPGAGLPGTTSVLLCRANGDMLEITAKACLVRVDGEPVFLVLARGESAEPGSPMPAAAPARAAQQPRERAADFGLIASVTHELRTPLNGILGMTDLLGGTALLPEQREVLDMLRASTRQLRVLLNDVLDISKIEAGQLHLEFIAFDVCQQVSRAVETIRPAAAQKGLSVDLKLATPTLGIMGDPTRVTQIMTNLLDNALKFTARGGIRVTLATEPPSAPGSDVRVRVSVADTGIGIAPEAAAQLFQPWHQASDSVARRYGGTGLGLALCRRLCRAMSGDISVTSQRGDGATFTFWIDARRSDAIASFADTQPMEGFDADLLLRGRRVLVADDNLVNRKLLSKWLEQEGAVVELAADGGEAVRRARGGDIDLILMDLSMPVMDGFDATRRIRQIGDAPRADRGSRPAAAVPIIGVTARAMPGDREACIQSGMDGYVTKPLKRHELIKTMTGVLQAKEAGDDKSRPR